MVENSWGTVREFYAKKGLMVCGERGRGSESIEIELGNVLFEGAKEGEIAEVERWLGKRLTPSYREFLSRWNGGLFFCHEEEDGLNAGFCLYSTQVLRQGHEDVVNEFREMIHEEDWMFEDDAEGKEFCLKWLDSVLVIGEELQSGNYIAIDYGREAESEEHPIVFMDHEVPLSYCDPSDDESVIAGSVDRLLLVASEDPAGFLMDVLGGTATYSDGKTDRQWYPKSYMSIEI